MGQTAGGKRIGQRLVRNQVCILDGAVGTELERRGYRTYLPLWTANAIYDCPDLLRDIHMEYILAGADIITANTFRTSRHTLAKAGKADEAHAYTQRAVDIAREAVSRSNLPVAIAGSIAPLEDCYTPELVPNADVIQRTYTEQLDTFSRLDIDLILFETMINRSEISILIELLSDTDIPFMMSFTADDNGRLLDGTPLTSAVTEVLRASPLGLLLNCRTPETITRNLSSLTGLGVAFGAYGNGAGEPGGPTGWTWDHTDHSDREYAAEAQKWVNIGARVIGGCCGTTPSTVRLLRKLKVSG